jgi:hypothetical protein
MTRVRDLANSAPGTTGQPLKTYSWYLANPATGYNGPTNGWYYSNPVTITLPSGLFTATPMVTSTIYQSGALCTVSLHNIGSSSFTVYHQQNATYAYGGWIMYTAVQQT